MHPGSVDALMREAAKRSLRLIAGKVLMDRNAPRALRDTATRGYDESKALIARWHGRGRLGYAITPRFAVTSSPAQLDAAGALWREHPDCWVQSHVRRTRTRSRGCGSSTLALATTSTSTHASGSPGGARSTATASTSRSASGGRSHSSGTAIAHCPTSNLFLGSGLFRWDRAKKPGRPVEVGLATDVGGGTTLSLLRTMGEAYKVARWRARRCPPRTRSGSRRRAARGRSTSGASATSLPAAEADLVVLDLASTPLVAQRMRHASDVDEALFVQMTLGDDRAIRQTWIGGRRVYRRVDGVTARPIVVTLAAQRVRQHAAVVRPAFTRTRRGPSVVIVRRSEWSRAIRARRR